MSNILILISIFSILLSRQNKTYTVCIYRFPISSAGSDTLHETTGVSIQLISMSTQELLI